MTSPGHLHVSREGEVDREEFDKLEKRVHRIERWVPVFLGVAIVSTAIVTAILKVAMVLSGQ